MKKIIILLAMFLSLQLNFTEARSSSDMDYQDDTRYDSIYESNNNSEFIGQAIIWISAYIFGSLLLGKLLTKIKLCTKYIKDESEIYTFAFLLPIAIGIIRFIISTIIFLINEAKQGEYENLVAVSIVGIITIIALILTRKSNKNTRDESW